MRNLFSGPAGLVGLVLICSAAMGQEYRIRFSRPAKVGDQFTLKVTSKYNHTVDITADGQQQQQREAFTALLEGTEEVLTVNEKTGDPAKLTIRVDKLKKDGSELYPAGTAISAETIGGKTVYKIAGVPMEAANTAVLDSLVDVQRPDKSVSEDDTFGTDKPQQVGGTWPINAEKTAKALIETNIQVDKKDLTGESKLVEVKKLNDVDVMVVKTVCTSDSFQSAQPSGISVSGGKFKVEFSATLPLDETLPAISASQKMTITMTINFPKGKGSGVATMERERKGSWETVKRRDGDKGASLRR